MNDAPKTPDYLGVSTHSERLWQRRLYAALEADKRGDFEKAKRLRDESDIAWRGMSVEHEDYKDSPWVQDRGGFDWDAKNQEYIQFATVKQYKKEKGYSIVSLVEGIAILHDKMLWDAGIFDITEGTELYVMLTNTGSGRAVSKVVWRV